MKKRLDIGLAAVVFLSGCASTVGSAYTETISKLPAIKEDGARIIVFKNEGSFYGRGVSASVKIDGTSIGKCDYKRFNSFDLPAGKHTLTVESWNPGSCSIKVELSPHSEYYFEIKPRYDGLASQLLLGGVLGNAVNAAEECSGTFKVESVSPDVAKEKLTELRLSD
ncbi:MAG: hypothetical protein ACYC9J_08670 [Sulfuricaulis sp.]